MGTPYVASTHHGVPNMVSVPKGFVSKTAYGTDLMGSCGKKMQWPQRKSAVLLKSLVQMFSEPCNVMLDLFAEMFVMWKPPIFGQA